MLYLARPNVAVHPAEERREAPLPRIGCNGLLAFSSHMGPQPLFKFTYRCIYQRSELVLICIATYVVKN